MVLLMCVCVCKEIFLFVYFRKRSKYKGRTSCVELDLCGLRWVSDLGVTFAVSDLLEVEPDLLTLMVGSSRCLVTGERSTRDSPAAWGVARIRRAAATSNRRGENNA